MSLTSVELEPELLSVELEPERVSLVVIVCCLFNSFFTLSPPFSISLCLFLSLFTSILSPTSAILSNVS